MQIPRSVAAALNESIPRSPYEPVSTTACKKFHSNLATWNQKLGAQTNN